MDGCSLIARKEGICRGKIRFLSFWSSLTDQLVVFAQDRTVTFFLIEEKPGTVNESSASKNDGLRELKEDRSFKLDYEFDPNEDGLFDVFVSESTMWIAGAKKEYAHSIHITRITKEECRQVELYDPKFSYIFLNRIRVGKNVVSIEDLKPEITQHNEAFVLDEIDFQDESSRVNSIVIQGACVALNGFGQYMLIWHSCGDGQNHLSLYSKNTLKPDISEAISCLGLGRGVFVVEAEALDRQAWTPDEKLNGVPLQLPLICVFIVKHSIAETLVWDANLNRVLTRIDVAIKEVSAL